MVSPTRFTNLALGRGVKTATATGGAVTHNSQSGKITTAALTTAQNGFYTLTITNDKALATDMAFASVANGTNSQGTPMIEKITPADGSLVIRVCNKHASAQAFNGTLVVSYALVKA